MDDIILVTIDCWRDDAIKMMPQLEELTKEWHSGSMICAAAATNGAFPAIFSSQFYPGFYQDDGSVPEGTASLPGVLGKHDYSTGGFVASNPSLGKWSEHFTGWWNDGMSAEGYNSNLSARDIDLSNKLTRFFSLRPRIPVEVVLERAEKWWEKTNSPRFLWVHIMEPHEPYAPGFDLGREIGLLKNYLSSVGHKIFDENSPSWVKQHLKRLHYQSYRRLDTHLTPWLKTKDKANIIVTGDHGEEFDHGLVKHARLYDETVRVPLFSNTLFESLNNHKPVRQLDIAPSILSEFDIPVPDTWEGKSSTELVEPQEIVNSSPALERSWVGIRSKSWKLICTYDWEEGFQQSEAYNINSDPDEKEPKSILEAPKDLRDRLSIFIDRPTISKEISSERKLRTGFNSEVEDRLERLGYME